jgi:hypothetical protein
MSITLLAGLGLSAPIDRYLALSLVECRLHCLIGCNNRTLAVYTITMPPLRGLHLRHYELANIVHVMSFAAEVPRGGGAFPPGPRRDSDRRLLPAPVEVGCSRPGSRDR